jgi:hypothetical protein
MKILFNLLFLCLAITSCVDKKNIATFDTYEDGISIEKFDTLIVDENRFNQNNIIYKVGKIFTFS